MEVQHSIKNEANSEKREFLWGWLPPLLGLWFFHQPNQQPSSKVLTTTTTTGVWFLGGKTKHPLILEFVYQISWNSPESTVEKFPCFKIGSDDIANTGLIYGHAHNPTRVFAGQTWMFAIEAFSITCNQFFAAMALSPSLCPIFLQVWASVSS